MPKTDSTTQRAPGGTSAADGWAPRVCTRCDIAHVDNCPTCFGFGLRKSAAHGENVPISAGEAHGDKPLPEWRTCPTCGGTPKGHEPNKAL